MSKKYTRKNRSQLRKRAKSVNPITRKRARRELARRNTNMAIGAVGGVELLLMSAGVGAISSSVRNGRLAVRDARGAHADMLSGRNLASPADAVVAARDAADAEWARKRSVRTWRAKRAAAVAMRLHAEAAGLDVSARGAARLAQDRAAMAAAGSRAGRKALRAERRAERRATKSQVAAQA